jgi:hypothetical protein
MSDKYRIVRNFMKHPAQRRGLPTGLTLEEAQEHCRDPETSSKTCTKSEGKRRTRERGPWFDGYERE